METLIIKVDNKKNVTFLRKLLQKLNFVTEIQLASADENRLRNTNKKEIPIQKAKSKPSIEDFAGIWEDRDISIHDLREKAWKRN